MPNPGNIIRHRFTSEHQPKHRRSRKGVPNRKTLLKLVLSLKVWITNPFTGERQKVTIEDQIILALIEQARRGNLAAILLIQDTMYGKN